MWWAAKRPIAAAISALLLIGSMGCNERRSVVRVPVLGAAAAPATEQRKAEASSDAVSLEEFQSRLRQLADEIDGQLGIAIIHVESGRRVSIGGWQSLALQSVFKLPLAVAILREVGARRVRLDHLLEVTAEDRAPGHPSNQGKWAQVPQAVSVKRLLEYSLIDSDNTSSDRLLEFLGGADVLTQRIEARLALEESLYARRPKPWVPSGNFPTERLRRPSQSCSPRCNPERLCAHRNATF